jgi:hypothetical protein
MARVITTENPSTDVRRFLRHWAAPTYTEDRLREQHSGISTDRRRTKARQIAGLVRQGLEFLLAADRSPTITKPLSLFYGAENLAKAACLTRDASLDADSIRSHGLSGERETKRYSVKNLACRIQQPHRDVWSHVFRSLNCDRHRYSLNVGMRGSLFEYVDQHSTPPLKAKTELYFGELLRHLPDLGDDVEMAGWGTTYMVRADEFRLRQETESTEKGTLKFNLRHGYRDGIKSMINACEGSALRNVIREEERHDVYLYKGMTPLVIPTIRPDVFGDLYLDLSRTRRELGELPLYLAALFILSDVVRYQAEHWLRLLADHPAEEIVVERFLDLAGRKVPNLILNELHQQVFEFKLSR